MKEQIYDSRRTRMQTTAKRIGFVAAALIVMVSVGSPAIAQDKSLYERLGRYDAIAAVVDEFIARFMADPQLRPFLERHSTDSLNHIRQLVVEQVCMATGGPCVYTGRTTKASHAGLGITEQHWQATVKHLV